MLRLALFLLLTGTSAAQQFAVPLSPGSSEGPIRAALDVDGDGDDDLVLVRADGNELIVQENRGAERFGELQRLPVVNANPRHGLAATGDVDGDGDPDLVLATATGTVLFQTATGRLQPGQTITPGAPLVVRLADLDGDQDLDLVTAAFSRVDVWHNDGTGIFTNAGLSAPFAFAIQDCALGDFDRDGQVDLAIAGTAGLQLWLRRGMALVDESTTRLTTNLANLQTVSTFDADGDLDLDLVAGGLASPGVRLLLNDGTGRFTDGNSRLPAAAIASALTAVAVDLEPDGDVDLLLGSRLLHNGGTGTFALAGSVTATLQATCDLDGDPRPDLFGTSVVARGLPGGLLRTIQAPRPAHAADLDGDGDPDLIGIDGSVFANEGSTAPTISAFLPVTGSVAAWADVDGDGDLDVASHQARSTMVFLRTDQGGMALVFTVTRPEVFEHVRWLDVDGDRDLDVLLAGRTDGAAVLVLGNQGGNQYTDITAQVVPAGLPAVSSLTVGDADADGDPDLLLGRDALALPGPAAALLQNQGNGTFVVATAAWSPAVGAGVATMGQFDHDPELEFVLALGGSISHHDRHNGVWRATSRLPVGMSATAATVLDVDGDGDQDLLTTGPAALLGNDGNGTFTTLPTNRGPLPTGTVTTLDFDGDGDLDLIDGQDLWRNQQRQLLLTTIPRPGGSLGLQFVAEPGFGGNVAVAFATLAFARSPQGLPLLGGRFLPDIAGSALLATMVSPLGQPGSAAIPVPANPVLAGLRLDLQGLVVGTRGELVLANHLVATIE